MITWFTGLAPRRRIFAAVLAALAVAGILAAAGAAIGRSTAGPTAGHRAIRRRTGQGRSCSSPAMAGVPVPCRFWPGRSGRPAGRPRSSPCPARAGQPDQGRRRAQRRGQAAAAVRRPLGRCHRLLGRGRHGAGLARDDGGAQGRRIISLGSPFAGTVIATTAQAFAPGACPVALQQLVPGGSLLARLSRGLPPAALALAVDDR